VILTDNKLMFLHFPRTGGLLWERLMKGADLTTEHVHARKEELPQSYDVPSFGFIRNPFEWCVSYTMRMTMVESAVSNGEFLSHFWANLPRVSKVMRQTYENLYGLPESRKEVSHIWDVKQREEAYVFAGEILGIDLVDAWKKVGPTNSRLLSGAQGNIPWQECYREEDKALVAEVCEPIIEEFGYGFTL
jgi:hypothetical protein